MTIQIFGDLVPALEPEQPGVVMTPALPLPFGEDAPQRYRLAILGRYGEAGKEGWETLVSMSRELLKRMPDNEFVQQQAWLCGLHQDGGRLVALLRTRLTEAMRADELTRRWTAWPSFDAMLNSKDDPTYFPSLSGPRGGSKSDKLERKEMEELADMYDRTQALRGDKRRAYRGGSLPR